MNDEGENKQSILFRIYHSTNVYSVPVHHILRIESLAGKISPMPRSPDYFVGAYRLHEKSIGIVNLRRLLGLEEAESCESKGRSLLVIADAQVGFLVEAVLSVETLHSRQSVGPFSGRFVHNVYFHGNQNDMILELDIPELLSFCQYPYGN